MTSLEPTAESGDQISPRRTNLPSWIQNLSWTSVLIGVAAGVGLGLVIGWLVWPVQWKNALPGDLNPEAKAQYLASVAESYVYYKDDLSAEIARNRLFDLNENLSSEIAAAQAFFSDNPQRNSRVHISNLGQLAQKLGVESPNIIVDEGADSTGPESVPAEAQTATSEETTNWLSWLLTFLVAVILVGAGIYVLGRFAQRRQQSTTAQTYADGFDDFDDEPYTTGATGHTVPTDLSKAAHEIPAFDTQIVDDYGFDTEDDDSPTLYSRGMAIDEIEPTSGGDQFVGESNIAQRQAQSAQSAEDDYEPQISASSVIAGVGAKAVYDAPDASSSVPPQPMRGHPGGSPGMILATFNPQYQAGDLDFEQSFNILDDETGYYIGECGMGVNMKNGVLQNNPENVIALDVWLFDKKTDKTLSSQTRVLLSEYAIDNDLEQAFTRERQNESAPVVAQPGVAFQLTGQNLVVDCQIIEAQYTGSGSTSGIFQNVKIEMTVRVKE